METYIDISRLVIVPLLSLNLTVNKLANNLAKKSNCFVSCLVLSLNVEKTSSISLINEFHQMKIAINQKDLACSRESRLQPINIASGLKTRLEA